MPKLVQEHRGDGSRHKAGAALPLVDAEGNFCSGSISKVDPDTRMIGLESGPLDAASTLLHLIKEEEDLPPGIVSASNRASAPALRLQQDLQKAVFLLNVCHMVIVISEGCKDTRMWELLQAAEMLAHGFPDLSLAGHKSSPEVTQHANPREHIAAIALVHTKVSANEAEIWSMLELQQARDAFFGNCPLRNVESRSGDANGQRDNAKVYRLCQPVIRGHRVGPTLRERLAELSRQLIACPKPNFAKTITEQAWLHGCERVWQQVCQSEDIQHYSKIVHE